MADCKACGAWFASTTEQDLCPTCERALKRLGGYVEPVKRGRWVDRYGGKYANPLYECSECKEAALYEYRRDNLGHCYTVQALSAVCPHCGAKMEG